MQAGTSTPKTFVALGGISFDMVRASISKPTADGGWNDHFFLEQASGATHIWIVDLR